VENTDSIKRATATHWYIHTHNHKHTHTGYTLQNKSDRKSLCHD